MVGRELSRVRGKKLNNEYLRKRDRGRVRAIAGWMRVMSMSGRELMASSLPSFSASKIHPQIVCRAGNSSSSSSPSPSSSRSSFLLVFMRGFSEQTHAFQRARGFLSLGGLLTGCVRILYALRPFTQRKWTPSIYKYKTITKISKSRDFTPSGMVGRSVGRTVGRSGGRFVRGQHPSRTGRNCAGNRRERQ